MKGDSNNQIHVKLKIHDNETLFDHAQGTTVCKFEPLENCYPL